MAISPRNLPPKGTNPKKSATTPAPSNPDFSEFSGTWSAEATEEFNRALAAMRPVDPLD